MKKEILLAITLFVAGCEKTATDNTDSYKLPAEMEGCKVFELESAGSGRITVIKCNSDVSTTYRRGKVRRHAAVVEVDTAGLGEYQRLKEKFGN